MVLVVDIGNSTVVSAIYDGDDLVERFTLPSRSEFFLSQDWQDNYSTSLQSFSLSAAFISSVVPSLTNKFLGFVRPFVSSNVLIGEKFYSQLPVSLINPDQIGTDLIANAVAAWTQVKKACVIVDFGTALTFTMVNDGGLLCGVAIAPGLSTALSALLNNTEQLELIPLEMPTTALGLNTIQAIQSGTIMGYSFLVKGLIKQVQEELGSHAKVFLTGGLSHLFVSTLETVLYRFDPNLTLGGIYQIGKIILRECK